VVYCVCRLNREVVMRLHEAGSVVPSLTTLGAGGGLKAEVIRIGLFNHRTVIADVQCLVAEVVAVGDELMREQTAPLSAPPGDKIFRRQR
jgi:hypothetical protein